MKTLSIAQKNSATSLVPSMSDTIKKYMTILFLVLPLVALDGGLAMAGDDEPEEKAVTNQPARAPDFVVNNTRENFDLYKLGRLCRLGDGSTRVIIHVEVNKRDKQLNIFLALPDGRTVDLEGGITVDTNPSTSPFPLTDWEWKQGVHIRDKAFVVANTPENADLYKVGRSIQLSDSISGTIVGVDPIYDYKLLNISLNGTFQEESLTNKNGACFSDIKVDKKPSFKPLPLTNKVLNEGVSLSSEAFVVGNTPENLDLYQIGRRVQFSDFIERKIIDIEVFGNTRELLAIKLEARTNKDENIAGRSGTALDIYSVIAW